MLQMFSSMNKGRTGDSFNQTDVDILVLLSF